MARILAPRILRLTFIRQTRPFPYPFRQSPNSLVVSNRKWRSHDSRPIKENPSFVVPLEQYDQSSPVSSSSEENEEEVISDPANSTEDHQSKRKLTLSDLPNVSLHFNPFLTSFADFEASVSA